MRFASVSSFPGASGVGSDMVRNPVLLVLVCVGALAGVDLAFLVHAPNRLVSGQPIFLAAVLHDARVLTLLPAGILAVGAFLPRRSAAHVLVAAASASCLLGLLWDAGDEAARLAATAPRLARTSFGGAFWILTICAALALSDALHRLHLSVLGRSLVYGGVAGGVALCLASGALNEVAIYREYAVRGELFAGSALQHMLIVVGALTPTIAIGVPLGIAAQRCKAIRGTLFPFLNIVQTIPSIALFGLLIAPLSGIGLLFPRLSALGIGGVGVVPAIVALVLYSMLPIARNTAQGIAGIAASILEAARSLGMTQRQIFWRVELPLALPVLLTGLRIATIQAIGLTAVAALIGAGGLGAIMFQGLSADALDLVLLGVIPIILMALAAGALFDLGIAFAVARTR
jgi:osmoprotectant transport system permease protein